VFEDEISKPWQRGEEHGFLRLKALVRAITIGRTKKVVELPVRIDEIHYLDFSPAERKRYETAEKDTVSLLEAISSGHQGGTFNALQRLNVLRLLCCHGLLAQSSQVRKAALSFNAPPEYWKQSREQELSFGDDDLNGDVLRGSASCYHCGSDLLQDLLERSPTERISSPEELSGQESKICVSCRSQMSWNEPCQMSQNFTSFLEPPESCISSGPPNPTSGDGTSLPIELMSTKIKALTADLLKHSGTEKRYDS
jgi:SWI/SNF-related matrix-associated actin-dependent regulator of chromatin subfamily A3